MPITFPTHGHLESKQSDLHGPYKLEKLNENSEILGGKRWMAVAFNILIRMGHNNRRHFFLVECNGGMNKDLNNNYNMYSYIFGLRFILFLVN